MVFHDVIFIFIAFLSEVLGTLSGFGSSTFFVPLAQKIESAHFVLVLTALLHVFGNAARIYQFGPFGPFATSKELKRPGQAITSKSSINMTELFIKFGLISILMAGLGAYLNKYINLDFWKQILGLGLMIISAAIFFKGPQKSVSADSKSKKIEPILWIALSGFLTGIIGTGGAIRGIALMSLGLGVAEFIALSAFIDIGGDVLRLLIYLKQGYMDQSQLFYIPFLIGAALGGTWVGKKILNKFDTKKFYKVVAIFIFISGFTFLVYKK